MPAHRARKEQVRGVTLGDLLATGYAIAVGINLRSDRLFRGQIVEGTEATLQVVMLGAALLVLWNLALWTQGTRNFDVIGSGAREYWEVTRITGVVFAIVVTISYSFKLELARGFVLFTFPVGLLLLLSWRFVSNWNARRPENKARFTPRAIVVTHDGESSVSAEALSNQFPDVIVMQSIALRGLEETLDLVVATAVREDVDFVIVGPAALRVPSLLRELAWALVGFDTRIIATSPLFARSEPHLEVTQMWGERVALVEDMRLTPAQRFKKRTFDLVLTLATLPIWLSLIAVLAAAVRCTSRGPAFFGQVRVGQDGSTFRMWKLRSMTRDAELLLPSLLPLNESTGPLFKLQQDPRITRLGAFLRRTSLDELPQLVNVIRGDMSLVGPRPQLPNEVAQYQGNESRRLIVQPGCTGLWQISGSAKLDWERSMSADLEYIHKWTLWGDCWLLVRTIPEILRLRGI